MEYIRTTKLINIGDSRGIVIPKSVLTALNIKRGDQFFVGIIDDQTIGIRRVSPADLLQFGKPKN